MAVGPRAGWYGYIGRPDQTSLQLLSGSIYSHVYGYVDHEWAAQLDAPVHFLVLHWKGVFSNNNRRSLHTDLQY